MTSLDERARDADGREILTDLLPEELAERLAPLGISEHLARRVYARKVRHGIPGWIVKDLAHDRARALEARFALPALEVVDRRVSPTDGFTKYLFRLHDGLQVEAVRIPIFDEKYTVCISSQAGCALACAFCATGRLGFKRNLAAWEMVGQVLAVRREADRPVRGVVFMGMGEPFLNYDAVIRAGRILSHPASVAIAGKAMTISTAGIVPAIRRYTAEGWPFRLAISISAGTSAKRRALMPIEKAYPLSEVIAAAREHALSRRTRITLAYVVISGVNCGVEDARALAELLRDVPVRLNLIEVNDASGEHLAPSAEELARFREALQVLGQPIVRRYSGGKDVNAACGMLAAVTGAPGPGLAGAP